MGDARSRPERQSKTGLEVNKHNSSMLELFTYNTLSGKAQPITIEAQRYLKILNANSDDSDAWFHVIDSVERFIKLGRYQSIIGGVVRPGRSEERRLGKEWFSRVSPRWSPYI